MENYSKCNKVKSDETKINKVVLYLTEMAMLWWKRKESEMEKGFCSIDTWEQFQTKFKKAFFPNNVIYEANRKFRELKQTGSIRAYMKEFTTLTLSIPNLTNEDMLFHFIDGLQNRSKTELERRQVRTSDEAITQAKGMTNLKHDRHYRDREGETRGSHGGDRGRSKDQQPHPKNHDTNKSSNKNSGCQTDGEKKE